MCQPIWATYRWASGSVGASSMAARIWLLAPFSSSLASDRRASDHGYTHLAFQVTDFDTVLARFLAAGGSVIKPLTNARPGGAKIHYCRDPFGNIIELLEMPEQARTRLRNLPGIAAEGQLLNAACQVAFGNA